MQSVGDEGVQFSITPDGSHDENYTTPSIVLPSEVFNRLDGEIDLMFAYFDSPYMFKRANQENTNFSVASSIISAEIRNHTVNNLNISDVIITLPLLLEVDLIIAIEQYPGTCYFSAGFCRTCVCLLG